MGVADIMSQAERLVKNNSTTILTSIGVVGTVTTAALSAQAALRFQDVVEQEQLRVDLSETKSHRLTPKEKAKVGWKVWVPPVASGVITVTCIVGANRIGSKKTAAIVAAYSVSEKTWSEYKDKVIEKLGENKERELRDELAQERIDRRPVTDRQVIIAGGDVLCYDEFSGRYFRSDVETIKKAQNDTNYQVLNDAYASLSDFYQRIGLPQTVSSEQVGWRSDGRMLEVQFSTCMSDDNQPCISVGFANRPMPNFHKFG